MTLTLRSASTTTGTTKGAALTHAEADANWLHALQSANTGFVQSGSGAQTSTVSAALRLYVHTSQYDTQGNYETARDALTGTTGLNNLDVSGTTTLAGHLLFTDNTYDIGASGATRPRTGYFGTSVVAPLAGLTDGARTIQVSVDASNGYLNTTTDLAIGLYTGGLRQFFVSHVASAVNYLQAAGGATGAPGTVTLSAQGSDANVDLAITPKGTGVLKFGTHTAIGAETVSGYITIKDSGGTSRKIAVVS